MGWHAWVGTLMQSFGARECFHTPHPSRCCCWPPAAAAVPARPQSSRWPPSLPPASHTCTAARPYKGQKVQLRDPETLRFRGRETPPQSSHIRSCSRALTHLHMGSTHTPRSSGGQRAAHGCSTCRCIMRSWCQSRDARSALRAGTRAAASWRGGATRGMQDVSDH